MLIGSPAGHRPIRLVQGYRDHAPGSVFVATEELARRLIAGGVAVAASEDDWLTASRRPERAVARPGIETREGQR